MRWPVSGSTHDFGGGVCAASMAAKNRRLKRMAPLCRFCERRRAGRDTEFLSMTASNRLRSALSLGTLLLLTEAVYMRPEILRGTHSLDGSDYHMLHQW